MCLDDGCDELLCCLCAPIAAILCCKICKKRMGPNNVHDAPDPAFYQQPTGRIPVADIHNPQGYDPRLHNQVHFYPGGPQPYYPPQHQTGSRNYIPPQQGYIKQQPRPY